MCVQEIEISTAITWSYSSVLSQLDLREETKGIGATKQMCWLTVTTAVKVPFIPSETALSVPLSTRQMLSLYLIFDVLAEENRRAWLLRGWVVANQQPLKSSLLGKDVSY